MMSAASEKQIAALRNRIRRVGRRSSRLFWPFYLLASAVVFALAPPSTELPFFLPRWPVVVVSVFIAYAGRRVYLRQQRRRLQHHLSRLPPTERAAVLAPLRADPVPDIRGFASELREDAADLTPATAPAGRGDEPTPASTRAE